ncbi:MAG: McrC family protein [Clostridia bacterium]|nr:McrC family protein [Clostridia bacterium]
MQKPFEVKEFETIVCNTDYKDSTNYRYLPKNKFDELSDFIREYDAANEETDVLEFFKLGYRRNLGDTITVKNYVGLIQLKSGFQIQILPKVDLSDDEDNSETKKVFLKMLRSLKEFEGKVFSSASLKIEKMNLYELFINMYLQEVRQLVKRGIKYSYVPQEDNLNYYKGKLLVGEHIKFNAAHQERFYVSFDEFHPNRSENKLVKATLLKLQKLTSSEENGKEIRQLLTAFELVEPSVNHEKEFAKVVIDRNTKCYEMLMEWSTVFLMNKSFSTFAGSSTAKALLFPMQTVFESYVAKCMKKAFAPNGWEVSSQDKGYHLFESPRKFALRPDIVMKKGERTIVLDTKWKKLTSNERQNYGISQSDMYQMYAYSKKYNTSEICLLYPINAEMRDHTPIVFDSGDGTTVKVYFVDIANIEASIDDLKNLYIYN